MTPSDIIRQFDLDTSFDENDFQIAAACAQENGLEDFSSLLRTQATWLINRKTPIAPRTGLDIRIVPGIQRQPNELIPVDDAWDGSNTPGPTGYGSDACDGSGFGDFMQTRGLAFPLTNYLGPPNPPLLHRYGSEETSAAGFGAGDGAYGSPPSHSPLKKTGQGYAFCEVDKNGRNHMPVGYGMGQPDGQGQSDSTGPYYRYTRDPRRPSIASFMKKLDARLSKSGWTK